HRAENGCGHDRTDLAESTTELSKAFTLDVAKLGYCDQHRRDRYEGKHLGLQHERGADLKRRDRSSADITREHDFVPLRVDDVADLCDESETAKDGEPTSG